MPGTPQRAVGVIGLGAMGLGVARSLLRAGFETLGCDVRPEALAALESEGGTGCADPAALGPRCGILIVLVVNQAQVEEVLFGPSGAVPTLGRGSVVIACATVPPSYAAALGGRLRERGILMLD